MRAFHSDPAVKARYLARVQAHHDADEIIHGRYWENGKGCAVGCTVHSGEHAAYETELGMPAWLARLEDGMFEAQENGAAKTFPIRFLDCIPVGADCEAVKLPFLAWLMDDPTYGVAFTATDDEVKGLAREVADRLRSGRDLSGPAADELSKKLWDAWAARDARDAWAAAHAWAAWDARDAFVAASVAELLRLLAALPAMVPESTVAA